MLNKYTSHNRFIVFICCNKLYTIVYKIVRVYFIKQYFLIITFLVFFTRLSLKIFLQNKNVLLNLKNVKDLL